MRPYPIFLDIVCVPTCNMTVTEHLLTNDRFDSISSPGITTTVRGGYNPTRRNINLDKIRAYTRYISNIFATPGKTIPTEVKTHISKNSSFD